MTPSRLRGPTDWLDVVLVATAVLPLTVVAANPARAVVGAVVASAALLVPGLRRDSRFWLGLAGLYGLWYWTEWRHLDNHAWLLAIWLGATAVGLRRTQPERELRLQATVILSLVFAFALGWKLRSPDFVTGAFFEYTLLTDPRFVPLAELTGVPTDSLIANQIAAGAGPESATLVGGETVRSVAMVLTWGTLVIETAVLATWAIPWVPQWLKHMTLALFCVLTYALAPVAGFGLILLAMGMAATRSMRGARAYLAGMAALFVWSAVWNLFVL